VLCPRGTQNAYPERRSRTARKSRAASLPGFNNQNQKIKHKLKYYGFSLLTAAAAMFVALPASRLYRTIALTNPLAAQLCVS
jgi:hypothetical protein